MSSESGPEGPKEPTLGPVPPSEDAPQDIDPAEALSNTEPDRLPPWLGMPDDDVKASRFSPGMILAGIAGLVIFGAIVWVVYQQTGSQGNLKPPPVITSDNTPTKMQPESPGGTDVPNQDKTVYDRVNPDSSVEQEHILPAPEEPQNLGSEPTASTPPPAAAQPKTVTEAAPPTPAPVKAPQPAPAKTQAASIPSGSYLIQLGAFGDDAGANRGWKALQTKFPSLLGGLSPDIQTADLGAKGVYHRLRAGPFSSRDAAETVCEELKAQKQGCLIVTP
jgi:cell division septation protein DedD